MNSYNWEVPPQSAVVTLDWCGRQFYLLTVSRNFSWFPNVSLENSKKTRSPLNDLFEFRDMWHFSDFTTQ